MTEEEKRLEAANLGSAAWRHWGPYLSERQWGTVREDYSGNGKAWEYFPHDHARSRAYRWGEDGLAGISDDKQQLCFAIALWNGQDPILKRTVIWIDRQRRKPWRRCEGILLLSGQHSKPCLHEISL